MSKYDCSKTLDYSHERDRMCGAIKDGDCDNCKLQGVGGSCSNTSYITQEHIDIVQKWSDEHPEKTRKEAFFEIFPKAATTMIDDVGVPVFCFGDFTGIRCEEVYGNTKCAECWLKPYAGEFEKAREE